MTPKENTESSPLEIIVAVVMNCIAYHIMSDSLCQVVICYINYSDLMVSVKFKSVSVVIFGPFVNATLTDCHLI